MHTIGISKANIHTANRHEATNKQESALIQSGLLFVCAMDYLP